MTTPLECEESHVTLLLAELLCLCVSYLPSGSCLGLSFLNWVADKAAREASALVDAACARRTLFAVVAVPPTWTSAS